MMFKKNWFNENVTEFLHANVGYCSEVNFMSKYFTYETKIAYIVWLWKYG